MSSRNKLKEGQKGIPDGPPIQATHAIPKFEPGSDAELIHQMAKLIAKDTNQLMEIYTQSSAMKARWSPKNPFLSEVRKFILKYSDVFDVYICTSVKGVLLTRCYLTPKGRDLFLADTPHATKPRDFKGFPHMIDDSGKVILPPNLRDMMIR